jgi:hypothetical protein
MSSPEVNPAVPVISAPPSQPEVAFSATVELAKADLVQAADGAIAYLAAAGEAAKVQVPVAVAQVSNDSEALAFKIAQEHGFSAYLSIFKSSIEAGMVKIEAGLSTEINALIDKGIAALKALKV